jgi:hypothetical protein
MNHRRRCSLRCPKKDAVLKRTNSQEPGETAGQKCGTADRQSEERKGEPGHGQSPVSIAAVLSLRLSTCGAAPWFHRLVRVAPGLVDTGCAASEDDLMLAVAALVSALAISLALI